MAEKKVDVSERLQGWNEKWDENNTRWHITKPNPDLLNYYHLLTSGKENLTFLLPLCGKSLDLLWLYQNGHTVIGIEGIEKAILEFFKENQLKYEVTKSGPGSLYETADNRLRIYQGDFFDYTKATVGEVDCIWDRGSMAAIFKYDRANYVKVLKPLLKPIFHYLLQVVEYESIKDVAPRSISIDEIKGLYGDFCNIELLETLEVNKEDIPHVGAVDHIRRHNLLLTRKSN